MAELRGELAWRPEVFRLAQPEDRKRLEDVRREGKVKEEVDTLENQLAELVIVRNPQLSGNPEAFGRAVRAELGESGWEGYGAWVLYPWSGTLVRTLDEAGFVEVRTNRNRLRLTLEEQQMLASKTIAVVGLSVGSTCALTVAMERSCGRIRLVDFDGIELSNLNRIRAGIAHIGLPKWVVTARAIAEVDPYLTVEVVPDGFKPHTVEAVLGGCDVVCDACDEFSAKALLRREAKRRGIPVVMDTSDRGMLDIERYDLPEGRGAGYLHGRISEADCDRLVEGRVEPQDLRLFVDLGEASERGRRSLAEVGATLVGWPQLYSEVAAGGAHAAEAARRILLGERVPDTRIFLALHDQLAQPVA